MTRFGKAPWQAAAALGAADLYAEARGRALVLTPSSGRIRPRSSRCSAYLALVAGAANARAAQDEVYDWQWKTQ